MIWSWPRRLLEIKMGETYPKSKFVEVPAEEYSLAELYIKSMEFLVCVCSDIETRYENNSELAFIRRKRRKHKINFHWIVP